MLINRTISSFILISLTAAVIFLFPQWVFGLVVTGLVGIGLYEFYSLVEHKGKFIYKYLGMCLGLLVPILFYFGLREGLEAAFIAIASFILVVRYFTRRTNEDALFGISATLFGIIYVSLFFSSIIKLDLLPNGDALVAYLLIVVKSGDVGAYIIGASLGRHKLIPHISPKKTIEGAAGGLLFSVIQAILCKGLLTREFGVLTIAIIGLALGALAQIGDLTESLIKRDCEAKDSSKLVPGFGGVLDILDSILFAAPAFYFFMRIVSGGSS